MGLDIENTEKDLAEYEQRRFSLWHDGNMREVLSLCREATAKYPKNYQWLRWLALALTNIGISSIGFTAEEYESSLSESLSLRERILNDCTDDEIRSECRRAMINIYDKRGNLEKALEEANKAPSIYHSKELLSDLFWIKDNKISEIQEYN